MRMDYCDDIQISNHEKPILLFPIYIYTIIVFTIERYLLFTAYILCTSFNALIPAVVKFVSGL